MATNHIIRSKVLQPARTLYAAMAAFVKTRGHALDPRFDKRGYSLWLLALALPLLLAPRAHGQYDPDWSRHFRLGAIMGVNIKADFALSGNIPIGGKSSGVYDDGYVIPSKTGSPVTGAWGYNDASQASGETLTMHRTTSLSGADGTFSTKNGSVFPGFELAYGGNLWYWRHFRIGWDFGFGMLPISISGSESVSDGTANQLVYTFSSGLYPGGGYPISIVQPGTHGTVEQNPNSGGGYSQPRIVSTPTSTNSATVSGTSLSGTQTLDVMLYTFRLGPTLYRDFNEYLGMSVSAGPALGIVSGSLKFDETLVSDTTAHNQGTVNGTDLVYGWYANATLMYHLVKHGDFYIGAQYMPLGSATISGQGHLGRLNLGGAAYLSAGINWPF